MTRIEVPTKKLLEVINHLRPTLIKPNKNPKSATCLITVKVGKITLSLRGGAFDLDCITEGTIRFSINFNNFYVVVKSLKSDVTEIIISDGRMLISNFSLAITGWDMPNGHNLRYIQLPINFSDLDLLRLKYEGYSEDELKFNKLNDLIDKAKKRFTDNLSKSYGMLKEYGVNYAELESLVMRNIIPNK